MQRRKRLSGCNPEEFQTLSNPQKISCIILRNLFGLYHQSCATDTLLLRKKIYPRQFSLNLKQRIIFMFLSISFTDFRSCMHHTYLDLNLYKFVCRHKSHPVPELYKLFQTSFPPQGFNRYRRLSKPWRKLILKFALSSDGPEPGISPTYSGFRNGFSVLADWDGGLPLIFRRVEGVR